MLDVVEILAATIPDVVDLDDERAVSEYLIEIAPVAGYTLGEVSRHIDAIIVRACELRADYRERIADENEAHAELNYRARLDAR